VSTPAPTGTQTAGNSGAPTTPNPNPAAGGRPQPSGKEPVPQRQPASTPARGPSGAAVDIQDSLDRGTRLIDQGDSVTARRMLMFVWNAADASKAQKGEAAFNIAATYGADRDNVINWLRHSDAMGFSAAAGALRTLGVGP
jgi:hypothetical protein